MHEASAGVGKKEISAIGKRRLGWQPVQAPENEYPVPLWYSGCMDCFNFSHLVLNVVVHCPQSKAKVLRFEHFERKL